MDGGQVIKPKRSFSVILPHNGMLMMVQEANSKYYGLWNHPQGGPEEGESPEQTAIREAKQETGTDIEILDVFGTFVCEKEDYREICFRARPLIFVPEPQPLTEEIIEARWFSRAGLIHGLRGKFRSPLTVIRLAHWLRNPLGGFGTVEIPPKGQILTA